MYNLHNLQINTESIKFCKTKKNKNLKLDNMGTADFINISLQIHFSPNYIHHMRLIYSYI